MGKKILLADDSITIQKVIELTFSDEDFEVVTVGNGRLAVEKVQDVRPDLVLCDIIMPEKDGYEVCDFIKKTPSLAHIPVLLLTGAFEPFDQDRASRVGCDGFLAKPFEPQTLIAKVKDLLNQAASRSRPAAAPAPAAPTRVVPVINPAAAPPPVSDFAEPNFISDEPAEETPTMVTPTRFEVGRPIYDEPPVPPPAPVPAPAPVAAAEELPYVEELAEPDELMDVSAEESATLQGAPPVEDAADAGDPSAWAQPTVELPLEMRAQASVESAAAGEATFDEVFEEESAPPEPVAPPPPAPPAPPVAYAPAPAEEDFGFPTPGLAGSPSHSSVPSPSAPATVQEGLWGAADVPAPPPPDKPPATASTKAFKAIDAPPPGPELDLAPPPPPAPETSFASVGSSPVPAEPPAPASIAAEVGVPADMVEKIAQRVVAQVSEKVIREIAWEVIPDLAENLIKKEIDRLKAELQQIS
jgi:CheY-like chemotaxis protein